VLNGKWLATSACRRAACLLLGAFALAACGGGGGSGSGGPPSGPSPSFPFPPSTEAPQLLGDEVRAIMESAARSIAREMVVAVTDRQGNILGVGVNFGLQASDCAGTVYPFTGASADCRHVNQAIQLARTASFFSADQSPLSSRTVRYISGIHFPPFVRNSGGAALFGIENTNRGCAFDAGFPDGGDFNTGKGIPRATNLASFLRVQGGEAALSCQNSTAAGQLLGCTNGIATVPGGIPIFKLDTQGTPSFRLSGGIGVVLRDTPFQPDPPASQDLTDDFADGAFPPDRFLRLAYDDEDENNEKGTLINRDFNLGEFAARAFAGDVNAVDPRIRPAGLVNVCAAEPKPACCSNLPEGIPTCLTALPVDPFTLQLPSPGTIFLDGLELPFVADNPGDTGPVNTGSGITRYIVDPGAGTRGAAVPTGYLIGPKAGSGIPGGPPPLSAGEVDAIVQAAIQQADITRAAIRLPLEARARFIIAVSDLNGELLALFRQDDATVFSIDVAVAKSRNVIYFSSPSINPLDTRDSPGFGEDLGLAFAPGTAITNRTISFGSQPIYPSGIDGTQPGPFRTVFLNDLLNPCTNGLEPSNGRQNGIVFFPGSAPLYREGVLVAGLGISGDGVEQDDLVTERGTVGYEPAASIRADQIVLRGARFPYLKSNRRPDE
jgi:uncharacterized protein GlcG (DUF336 family)